MELPKRKPNRLKGYDYSIPGAYFVTICTKDRKQLLSEISNNVGDGVLDVPNNKLTTSNSVGDGVLDVPNNKLTKCGKIAEKYIKQLSAFYEDICIDKYVIMPNHIHLILMVINSKNGTSETPSPTNSVVAKFISTFKRFCNREYGENIWQRSYHDHIIRGEKDYQKIWEYIDTNAIKWKEDCFYNE